ncbi:uncharacterized protein LOC8055390 [Sorghum bicolor]|uniref:CCT domain-containing protein n=1 Tax=Sorghum bicolor TaxID=4558 RepID=C5YPP9_SORBI|nr:uncharacterized protein LOC8055390 [Sorghum bicolor]EES15491.2 hypothetical protein SORBI_3008G000700 [Sorghum bicolor]|eukprot:XP_002441653.2 uncharacterized protein LOC8055390 [Sorghum bicolor]
MYQQHRHWANSSCYCVDDELKAGDPILSRPDALLANGGAFLPSPPPPNYMSHYSQPPPGIVPPPMVSPSQLHAITTSSSGMAAATSFRRALSTGDLIVRDREEEQRAGAAAAAAVTRYTAEERRERIDKYRSKRNQRNFQKKITYACRKTLADSRPRVKGRFARNGGDYTEADADHHVHVLAEAEEAAAAAAAAAAAHRSESPAATAAASSEWWPAVQEEGINLAELCAEDDDEMLAAYLGVSSISIADHHYSCHP